MNLREFRGIIREQGSELTDKIQAHLKKAVESEGRRVIEFKLIGQGIYDWGAYFSVKIGGPLFGGPLVTDNVRAMCDVVDSINTKLESDFVKKVDITIVEIETAYILLFMTMFFKE